MTLQGVGIVLSTENYNVWMDLQVHPKRGHGSQATDKKGGGVLFSEEYNGLQESRAIEVAFAAPPSAYAAEPRPYVVPRFRSTDSSSWCILGPVGV